MEKINIDSQDSTVKILLVEDDRHTRARLVEFLKQSFPRAEIRALQHFLEDEDVEDLIKKNQYSLAFLDASLKEWKPHPKFKIWGGYLLPVFKEHSPRTITVAISSDDGYNQHMIEHGATIAVNKNSFEKGKKFSPDLRIIDI